MYILKNHNMHALHKETWHKFTMVIATRKLVSLQVKYI